MNKKTVLCLASALGLLATMLAACAKPGPILLQDILYQAPTSTVVGPSRTIIAGIGPLADVRGREESILGKRTISDDILNDLVVQGTVGDLATKALKDALGARGVTVKDAPAWNIEAGPGVQSGADLLFAGEIKDLWVDVHSRPLQVKTTASVKLRVAMANAGDGTVLRTLNLSSTLSREDIAFSFDTVQRTLSEALTSALDQLLEDAVVQERMR